ncbi:uncharacterized protein BDR25DRAFT_386277 [Lindgomyces ingoldianus]|uniref:Uncharacterized protein n=1 Tax=Lindgomyces ingoldianus TaxID=673940 RepID=A0ACB6Q756_9PLEO|nr:uncharacterized protein BDR25DRAFT_386277 [Lindgomyces ingoldianus]KAF2462661.1 hypothetical protein BDR25DRAFT_386277 [Lindgomyces ingoldianus]
MMPERSDCHTRGNTEGQIQPPYSACQYPQSQTITGGDPQIQYISAQTPHVQYSQTQHSHSQDLQRLQQSQDVTQQGKERNSQVKDGIYCHLCEHGQQVKEEGDVEAQGYSNTWLDFRTSKPDSNQEKLKKEKKRLQVDKSELEEILRATQKSAASERLDYENKLRRADAAQQRLENEKDGADREIARLRQEMQKLNRQKAAVCEELAEERSFTKQLQIERRKHEAVIGKAQSAFVSKLSDMVSTELPDDKVREQLQDIFKDSQEWAKENCACELENTTEMKERLVDIGVLAPEDSMEPHDYFNFNADIITDILLEAVLNHYLCSTFISNPFFTSSSALWTDETSVDENVLIVLQRVTDYLQIKRAAIWRSDTIKLLMEDEHSHTQKKLAAYRRLAKSFIQRWRMLIRSRVEVEEEELLVGLIARFADLTSKLWCLKADIEFHGLDHFGGEVRFRVCSNEMSGAQVLSLEDGSTRLDGRPIPLVIQPKIDASRKTGCNHAGKRTIWAKGVVWVSNQAVPKLVPKCSPMQLDLMNEVLTGASDTVGMQIE